MQHTSSLLFLSALPLFKEVLRTQLLKWQMKENSQIIVHMSRRQARLQDQIVDLIMRAFEGVGFKGPIYINFTTNEADHFNAACGSFWVHGQRAASVDVMLPKNMNVTLNEIYAAAGHEAIHAKHEHLLLGDLVVAGSTIALHKIGKKFLQKKMPEHFPSEEELLFSQNLMLGIAAFGVASLVNAGMFSRLFERDADVASVKKLGTAFDLISLFNKIPDETNNPFKKVFASHPSNETRINYLTRYIPGSATMFQPTKQQALLQEELCLGRRVIYR